MKIYSSGRSEIIEQAGRKSFHMWFDIDIEPFGISLEADLSLPTKSTRKISMMTSFNEELYNSASDFLWKVKLYDSDMREFSDDMLVTLVTKMIHNTIQRLNTKWEPLWNIFVKTPKAKAKELELAKEEYLWKSKDVVVVQEAKSMPIVDEVQDDEIIDIVKPKKKVVKPAKNPVVKTKITLPNINENPFFNTNNPL